MAMIGSRRASGAMSGFVQSSSGEESVLISLMEAYEWAAVLARVTTHPSECRVIGTAQGRTPLHVACDHDAPAVVIQALLKAHPEAAIMVGTSKMIPLHITASSSHASVHVVRVLLEGGPAEQVTARDVDGDTPLHAACRCGAPFEVLEVLLRANPSAVHERDYEGLTPLLRLWVRYFVILGDDTIESVNCHADLQGELLEAWNKTELLLKCAHHGGLEESSSSGNSSSGGGNSGTSCCQPDTAAGRVFRMVHAASAIDCPRPIVKIAARVYPRQLDEKDEYGRTPLMIACQAPIFKVRDLTDDGYTLEDVIHGDESKNWVRTWEQEQQGQDATSSSQQPSVIGILLQANQDSASSAACVPDLLGRLPLHVALHAGKSWKDGVKELIEVYPDALNVLDEQSRLYPFMLAAEGWRGDLSTTFAVMRQSPSLVEDLTVHPGDSKRPGRGPRQKR